AVAALLLEVDAVEAHRLQRRPRLARQGQREVAVLFVERAAAEALPHGQEPFRARAHVDGYDEGHPARQEPLLQRTRGQLGNRLRTRERLEPWTGVRLADELRLPHAALVRDGQA